MHASSRSSRFVGLRIKGRPAEESESGRAGSGLGSPTAVVAGVLPVGYLPPLSKGKGKIREIRYPCGSEYLGVVVRYVDAMALAELSFRMLKPSLLVIDLPPVFVFGVLTFSRLMLFLFPRRSAFLR